MRPSRGWKFVSTNLFRPEFVWVIKMPQCDRIDVSEGTDINETSESKEWMLCHYSYFKDVGYKFQPYVCNGCQAVSMAAYELKKHCNIKCKRCWL